MERKDDRAGNRGNLTGRRNIENDRPFSVMLAGSPKKGNGRKEKYNGDGTGVGSFCPTTVRPLLCKMGRAYEVI